MNDLDTIKDELTKSKFYKDLQPYFQDSILKALGEELGRKRQIRNVNSYDERYKKNLEVMKSFYENYIKSQQVMINDETKWFLLNSIYLDPDSGSVQKNVACGSNSSFSADGIISLRKMYYFCKGDINKVYSEYETYRKKPIFHFLQEGNGINQSRKRAFNDRIDYTLLDIKNFCDGKDTIMKFDRMPKTKEYLTSMGFEGFISDLEKMTECGIIDVFVREKEKEKDYEIFNIEKNSYSLNSYEEGYSGRWSEKYYENLKVLVLKSFSNLQKKSPTS